MIADLRRQPPDLQSVAVAIIAVGLVLRLAFAVANAYWLHIPHQDGFHRLAVAFAAGEVTLDFRISYVYGYLLGLVYAVTGPHEIVGYAGSALAWTGAALTLDAMLKLMRAAPRARLAALLVFGLTPSSIYFGSVIMRDVYELIFVNLMMLAALRIYVERDYDAVVPMVLAGAALAFLHKGLMPWAVIASFSVLGWVLVMHRERVAKQALLAIIVLAFTLFIAALFQRFGYDMSGGLDAAVGTYRDGVEGLAPRTNFRLFEDLSAGGGIVAIIVGLLRYMLEPLPWDVERLGDLAVLGENAVRLVLIGMAVLALVVDRQRRAPLLLVLLAYCCLEGIWSLGTVAWGTAIRHHLPGSGMLLVAAFASFRLEGRGNSDRDEA